MRAGSSDVWVFDQLFLYRELDTEFGSEIVRIIDAGANIGLASVYLANRFQGAQILALEVDDGNFGLLVDNTRPYPKITPLRKGLWCRQTRLRIDNPNEYSSAFTVSESPDGEVEAVGVADLLNDFRWPQVDLLKMDIEGAELEVLSFGSEQWIDRVRVLAIEVHYQRMGC
ncbi:MAG: FkbM family methyltransferase [Acidobacteriota bacterium]